MKILDIKQLSSKYGLGDDIIRSELLEILDEREGKSGKTYLFDESVNRIYVVSSEDIDFIDKGYGKYTLVSLSSHFGLSLESTFWVLQEIHKKELVDKKIYNYYTEVKEKPSVTAGFEPKEILVGQEAVFSVEILSPVEIRQPKLSIVQRDGIEFSEEIVLPPRLLKGKSVQKCKCTALHHGKSKVEVMLEGVVDGKKYGPEKVTDTVLIVRPLAPKLSAEVYPVESSAIYKQDFAFIVRIYNDAPGEARSIMVDGLQKHPQFDVLSGEEAGNLTPNGRIEHTITLRPRKSGAFPFKDLSLVYKDAEGKDYTTPISAFAVDVSTPKPLLQFRMKTPKGVRGGQEFPLGITLTNVGEGEGRNIRMLFPVDPKILVSGQPECEFSRLKPGDTEETELILRAPESGEFKISDFEVQLADIEGNSITQKCEGATVSIREGKEIVVGATDTPSPLLRHGISTAERLVKILRGSELLADAVKIGIKVENISGFTVSDVSIKLDVPKALRLDNPKSSLVELGALKPNEAQAANYWLKSRDICFTGPISGTVTFYDHGGTPFMVPIPPVDIAMVCPNFTQENVDKDMVLSKLREGALESSSVCFDFVGKPEALFKIAENRVKHLIEVERDECYIEGTYVGHGCYAGQTKYKHKLVATTIDVSGSENQAVLTLTIYSEDPTIIPGYFTEVKQIVEKHVRLGEEKVREALNQCACCHGELPIKKCDEKGIVKCPSCGKPNTVPKWMR